MEIVNKTVYIINDLPSQNEGNPHPYLNCMGSFVSYIVGYHTVKQWY